MIEEFKPTRSWDMMQHRHRLYQSVVCGGCGFVENIPMTKFKPLAPNVIIRQMQHRHWLMGNKRRDDRCPRCASKRGAFS